jgi:hypothetical protein
VVFKGGIDRFFQGQEGVVRGGKWWGEWDCIIMA